MMKNFIFISPHFPSSYWRFCLALKNRGFRVLGIGDAPYNELGEECRFALDEYYCCTNMDDFENEKKAVQYFQDKYGKIDYIESNNEYWLEKDARLRSEFNVTTGPTLNDIEKYKLKSLQKEYYAKAGLKCARYILVDSLEKAKEFANTVNYPVFAKPNNGVGAQDTHKFNNEVELEAWFARKDPKKVYIMEEYVNGKIISFDGVSDSKSDVIFATSNVFENDNSAIVQQELDDMYYCVPKISDEFLEMVESVGWKTYSKKQIDNALANTMYMVKATVDGKLAGIGRVVGDYSIVCMLTDICVKPEFQKHGIGLKIVKELKRLISSNVYEGEKMQIELTPTAGNESFYQKAGFKYNPKKITGMYLWIKK